MFFDNVLLKKLQTGTKVVKVWLGECTLLVLVVPTFSFGLGLTRSEPSPVLCTSPGQRNPTQCQPGTLSLEHSQAGRLG